MDRLIREGNPPVGQLASPVPQYKRPGSTDYEPVEGQHGAPFAILKDASGNVVSPATEAKLEQVRALLSGVATEAKLEQARVLLNSINSKDFATASKQDALNTVVEDLKSELALVKAELQAIKANQTSGDQKVQLSGTKSVTREVLLDAVSVAPLSQTNNINLNITNEKKVVLLVWSDLDAFSIRSSAPWQSTAGFAPDKGSLYPVPSNFGATELYKPHVLVWVGMQHERLGLTDIKEALDIALPPVSPSFIRVWNNDPDETLTITIHILRYWG